MTPDEAKAYVDTRVRVYWGGTPKVALLRAVTPKEMLILASAGGMETLVPLSDVRSIEDARFACTKCGSLVNRVFGETEESAGRCAVCTRVWAAQQPKPRETCPDCGVPGAVYSPKFKVWRCPQCHAKNGSFTGSTVEMHVLTQAPCKTADKDSPLHDWKQFKSQWVCRACEVKVFGKPKHA